MVEIWISYNVLSSGSIRGFIHSFPRHAKLERRCASRQRGSPQRVFSVAGLTVTWLRSRLTPTRCVFVFSLHFEYSIQIPVVNFNIKILMINQRLIVNSPDDRLRKFSRMPIPSWKQLPLSPKASHLSWSFCSAPNCFLLHLLWKYFSL